MKLLFQNTPRCMVGPIEFPQNPKAEAQKVADSIVPFDQTASTDKNQRSIISFEHPEYTEHKNRYELFRDCIKGGAELIEKYVYKYSNREDTLDLKNRKRMSYPPTIAKGAVTQVKNAIFHKFGDISRKNGPVSYLSASNGENTGVDRLGSSMNTFTGRDILPELTGMGKIGVFIDQQPLPPGHTMYEEIGKVPYLYTYKAEDILAWTHDDSGEPNEFTTLLLREHYLEKDPLYDLPTGLCKRYRYLRKTDAGIEVIYFNEQGRQVNSNNILSNDTYLIELPVIPFVVYQLSESLLNDIAYYQIALLNLASSDMNYAVLSNFPFYVEQFDPNGDEGLYKTSGTPDNRLTKDAAIINQLLKTERNDMANRNVNLSPATGRRYPKGIEAPQFIHPSSEPLTVSMIKQKQLKDEIREILTSSLSNITAGNADLSAQDNRQGLESGLNNIGIELEYGERRVAAIWSLYMGSKDVTSISYPKTYSILSEEDRRKEAKDILDLKSKIPSMTYQKESAKDAVRILFTDKLPKDKIAIIEKEIDEAKTMTCDADEIQTDHEGGLVGDALASEARGYPPGEVEVAKKDKADRLAMIQMSQSAGGQLKNPASRGVSDLSPDPSLDTTTEKKAAGTEPDKLPNQRGEGK